MWYLVASVPLGSVWYSIISASKFCSPDQLFAGQGSSFLRASEIESRRNPCQAGGILFHIVEFCDLRGGVAQKVSYLPGREGADGSIRLFDAVDQIGGEGVAEGVEAPPLQASRGLRPDRVPFFLSALRPPAAEWSGLLSAKKRWRGHRLPAPKNFHNLHKMCVAVFLIDCLIK